MIAKTFPQVNFKTWYVVCFPFFAPMKISHTTTQRTKCFMQPLYNVYNADRHKEKMTLE